MTFEFHGPLYHGNPLYQSRNGLAREEGDEITDLAAFIDNAALDAATFGVRKYFTINGSRQSGKTSLLLETAERIKASGGFPCWLDFQRVYAAAPEQSVGFVAREIVRAIPPLANSIKVPDRFEHGGYDFDHWLLSLPLPEGKPVVLLMEELGALSVDSRKFLGGLLRGAFADRSGAPWARAVLVLFGGIELHDMVSVEVSPFYNICSNISLFDLNEKASTLLVLAGFAEAEGSDRRRVKQLARSIYAQVSGHPYLTQYIGHRALSEYRKNGRVPGDIQSILARMPMEKSDYIRYLFHSMQRYELTAVSRELLEDRQTVHADDGALLRLELLGVLGQREENRFVFRNQLIRNSLSRMSSGDKHESDSPIADRAASEIETDLIRMNKIEQLSVALANLPCMKTPKTRRELLLRSGIEGRLAGRDAGAKAKDAGRALLQAIQALPRLANGKHPLGLFLTAVKASRGSGVKVATKLVDSFIAQYGLMDSNRLVAVSYAFEGESERVVDEIELAFADRGFGLLRDQKHLGYKGSIKEFEERIGEGQCVVLVISDRYLRSAHCMFELIEVAEHSDFRRRVFPIVLENARIYEPIDRVEYVRHWDKQVKRLEAAIRELPIASIPGLIADLKKYGRIRDRFESVASQLGDMKALTPEMLTKDRFATLIRAIEASHA